MAVSGGGGVSLSQSQQAQQSTQQSQGQQQSTSFIPDYSQTPILNSIAQYAQNMAPVVYQWGMDQFGRYQGRIDDMMRNALTYASPQRIKAEMGMAEAGVMQAGEAARQGAVRELESFGVDPSSGRYAALDQANRVQTAAAAAGAGNQQRMATQAAGNAMENQALSAGMQNVGLGYGAGQSMANLLGVGMNLKYSPLGQQSQGYNTSIGQSSGSGWSQSESGPASGMGGGGSGGMWPGVRGNYGGAGLGLTGVEGGSVPEDLKRRPVEPTSGGFVSRELSPSGGDRTDDVNARLNAGEFVIPKDIVQWKGKEFFAKLIVQSRKARAMGDGEQQQERPNGQPTGYAGGGYVSAGEVASNKRNPAASGKLNPITGADVLWDPIHRSNTPLAFFQEGGPVMPQRGTVVNPPEPRIPGYTGYSQPWGGPWNYNPRPWEVPLQSVAQPAPRSSEEMRPSGWTDLPQEPRGYAGGGMVARHTPARWDLGTDPNMDPRMAARIHMGIDLDEAQGTKLTGRQI